MAYLRGSSYVDGDLVVAGSLQVKQLASLGENIPYLRDTENGKQNYLVQFSDNAGGLQKTSIFTQSNKPLTTVEEDAQAYLNNNPSLKYVVCINDSKNVYFADSSELVLDELTLEWKYSES